MPLPVDLLSNAVDPPHGVGTPHRVVESPEPDPGQQVGKVSGTVLDRDYLGDFLFSPTLAHDDAVFRLAFDRDDDLAAVGEVTGLGEVVQRVGGQLPLIEELEAAEHLQKNRA